MKNTLILFLTILISNALLSQSSNLQEPNKSVIRLTVLNDKGEILMKKSSLGWVTIATFHEQRQNYNEVIDSLANTYGIKITKPSLGGIFTYKYSFKNSADTRHMYVAKHIGGEIRQGVNDYYFTWFPKEEAIEKLKNTVPSLGEMTEQILDFPNELWGASFFISRDAEGNLDSEITESFYPLRNNQHKKQSEYALIENTLQNYMEGGSYNKLEMLENAFAENATLYLTGRDGAFKIYTPKEYCGFFKNGKKGEFNGRNAKVLAIEVVKDIATAKVEIAGPERKWVYIDLFLLKKFENGWKIISKTATRVDDASNN